MVSYKNYGLWLLGDGCGLVTFLQVAGIVAELDGDWWTCRMARDGCVGQMGREAQKHHGVKKCRSWGLGFERGDRATNRLGYGKCFVWLA